MVLKLDTRFPLVWRDPTSLQLGVANPVAVLADVSSATERMIAALVTGISESGLFMIGRSAGATDNEVGSLLDAVRPALVPERRLSSPPTVLLVGSGPTVDRTADALAADGIRVRITVDVTAAAREDCSLAIIVAHFVIAPDLHGIWLRRDIPHLPVVVSDTEVVIGPMIEPGSGPCLYCLQRYRSDADPAWPAIATQLHGRHSGAETPLVAAETAAIVGRLALERTRGDVARVHESIRLIAATGETTTRSWLPHPECGCLGLADTGLADMGGVTSGSASAAIPTGTGSPGAGPRAVVRLRTTTATATSGRE